MKTQRIIEVILNTQALHNRLIWLAAVCAQTGELESKRDVQNWWLKQGGTVDDMAPLVEPGQECQVLIGGQRVRCVVKQSTCDEFVLTVKTGTKL